MSWYIDKKPIKKVINGCIENMSKKWSKHSLFFNRKCKRCNLNSSCLGIFYNKVSWQRKKLIHLIEWQFPLFTSWKNKVLAKRRWNICQFLSISIEMNIFTSLNRDTWCGIIKKRNLRDIWNYKRFIFHLKRHGFGNSNSILILCWKK